MVEDQTRQKVIIYIEHRQRNAIAVLSSAARCQYKRVTLDHDQCHFCPVSLPGCSCSMHGKFLRCCLSWLLIYVVLILFLYLFDAV